MVESGFLGQVPRRVVGGFLCFSLVVYEPMNQHRYLEKPGNLPPIALKKRLFCMWCTLLLSAHSYPDCGLLFLVSFSCSNTFQFSLIGGARCLAYGASFFRVSKQKGNICGRGVEWAV